MSGDSAGQCLLLSRMSGINALQAIKAKAESLLGVLEQVDAVPVPSSSGVRWHAADGR